MEWWIMIVVGALVYLFIKFLCDQYNRPKEKRTEVTEEEIAPSQVTFVTREPGNSLLGLLNVDNVTKIPERFKTTDDVTDALRSAGLKSVNLIFGIDYTASNYRQGALTYGGKNLHDVTADEPNPYQKVITTLGETLEPLSTTGVIPAFGFGDSSTRDVSVFDLKTEGNCRGFKEVLSCYNNITPTLRLSGPTNFAPLIYKAIAIVEQTKAYHILVIVADGQVTREQETREAIIEASRHALSIVMIGVGDGPWGEMDEYDDQLPDRCFDNFHFVDYHKVTNKYTNSDAAFAIQALLEVPDQYKSIRHLGYIR